MEDNKITVKAASGEMSGYDIYALTNNPEIQKLSSAEGQILEITDWIIYEDVDTDGEAHEIFACRTREGEAMASSSPTVVKSFNSILRFADSAEEIQKIKVISQKSRNDRKYYSVIWVK